MHPSNFFKIVFKGFIEAKIKLPKIVLYPVIDCSINITSGVPFLNGAGYRISISTSTSTTANFFRYYVQELKSIERCEGNYEEIVVLVFLSPSFFSFEGREGQT